MMAEWEEYTGSDGQIAEIEGYEKDILFRLASGNEMFRSAMFIDDWKTTFKVVAYMLCNPHPLATMIKQWTDTGQPVWIKIPVRNNTRRMVFCRIYMGCSIYVTYTPDWNISGAEYSFTPFEEVK